MSLNQITVGAGYQSVCDLFHLLEMINKSSPTHLSRRLL